MKLNWPLTLAGYTLACYLVVVPLWESAFSTWAPGMGGASWRFGAVGLLTQAFMTPLLGLLIAVGIAYVRRDRKMMRLLAMLGGLAAFSMLVLIPVFLLDFTEMRGRFGVDAGAAVTLTTGTAVMKMLLTGLIGFTLARGGWSVASEWGGGVARANRNVGVITGMSESGAT